jgi:hypothetical protein
MTPGLLQFKVEQAKGRFFDRARVVKLLDEAELRSLSRVGAFVRTRAQSILRYRDKSSPPGQPPSVHRHEEFQRVQVVPKGRNPWKASHARPASQFKELIFFALDESNKSVVIGPALLNGGRTNPTVPELHEFGGEITVEEVQLSGGLWVRSSRVANLNRPRRTVQAVYPPRPFMKPALDSSLADIARKFKDVVR